MCNPTRIGLCGYISTHVYRYTYISIYRSIYRQLLVWPVQSKFLRLCFFTAQSFYPGPLRWALRYFFLTRLGPYKFCPWLKHAIRAMSCPSPINFFIGVCLLFICRRVWEIPIGRKVCFDHFCVSQMFFWNSPTRSPPTPPYQAPSPQARIDGPPRARERGLLFGGALGGLCSYRTQLFLGPGVALLFWRVHFSDYTISHRPPISLPFSHKVYCLF